MIRRLVLVSLALLVPRIAAAIDITTCGQVVPPGQVGEVLNDLDCSGGTFSAGVTLLAHATLHLNGHRINGPVTGVYIVHASESAATVVGPGEVDTADDGCIGGDLANVVVDGGAGIEAIRRPSRRVSPPASRTSRRPTAARAPSPRERTPPSRTPRSPTTEGACSAPSV